MKRKYYGLTSMIVMGVSFLSMLGYGIFKLGNTQTPIRLSTPPPLSQIGIPDDQTLAQLNTLNQNLFKIASLSGDTTPLTLKILGHNPVDNKNNQLTSRGIKSDFVESETPTYHLSMCFVSPKKSFCMIDNELYAENSTLPDNEKIIKIEHDRVQIKTNSIKHWIYLSRKIQEDLLLKEKS